MKLYFVYLDDCFDHEDEDRDFILAENIDEAKKIFIKSYREGREMEEEIGLPGEVEAYELKWLDDKNGNTYIVTLAKVVTSDKKEEA